MILSGVNVSSIRRKQTQISCSFSKLTLDKELHSQYRENIVYSACFTRSYFRIMKRITSISQFNELAMHERNINRHFVPTVRQHREEILDGAAAAIKTPRVCIGIFTKTCFMESVYSTGLVLLVVVKIQICAPPAHIFLPKEHMAYHISTHGNVHISQINHTRIDIKVVSLAVRIHPWLTPVLPAGSCWLT